MAGSVLAGFRNDNSRNGGDGGFRTGDLGHLDADGFLWITGRLKEQYKLENGKYVVPVPIEEQLQLSGFISSAMVYGQNKPFNVALLVPDRDALLAWARGKGLNTADMPALLQRPEVQALYREQVLARYRLTADQKAGADAFWQACLSNDGALRGRFEQAQRTYQAWLASAGSRQQAQASEAGQAPRGPSKPGQP